MQSEQPVVLENNAAAASQPGKEPVVQAESVEVEGGDELEKAFLKENREQSVEKAPVQQLQQPDDRGLGLVEGIQQEGSESDTARCIECSEEIDLIEDLSSGICQHPRCSHMLCKNCLVENPVFCARCATVYPDDLKALMEKEKGGGGAGKKQKDVINLVDGEKVERRSSKRKRKAPKKVAEQEAEGEGVPGSKEKGAKKTKKKKDNKKKKKKKKKRKIQRNHPPHPSGTPELGGSYAHAGDVAPMPVKEPSGFWVLAGVKRTRNRVEEYHPGDTVTTPVSFLSTSFEF